MSVNSTVAFASGAIVALVLGSGTAYAANGGNFKLGQSNSASRPSSLSNPNGTALVLSSRASQPSLKVNRTAKVPNLNADRVDSLDSTQLARNVQVGTVAASGSFIDLNEPSTQTTDDDTVVAVAECPTDSQVMGGGADDLTPDGFPVFSGPDTGPGVPDAWVVISTADPTTADPADLTAFARCWNPRANVGDSSQRTTARMISPSTKQLARKVAARR